MNANELRLVEEEKRQQNLLLYLLRTICKFIRNRFLPRFLHLPGAFTSFQVVRFKN